MGGPYLGVYSEHSEKLPLGMGLRVKKSLWVIGRSRS